MKKETYCYSIVHQTISSNVLSEISTNHSTVEDSAVYHHQCMENKHVHFTVI